MAESPANCVFTNSSAYLFPTKMWVMTRPKGCRTIRVRCVTGRWGGCLGSRRCCSLKAARRWNGNALPAGKELQYVNHDRIDLAVGAFRD